VPRQRMGRRRRRRKKRKSSRRYYQHIYFESKRPGRDSVTAAVFDIGRPGVSSSREVKLLAFAQLVDYADGKTVDHYGRVRKFTGKLWAGRSLVLRRLADEYGGKRAIEVMQHYKHILANTPAKQRKHVLLEAAKKMGIDKPTAETIIRKLMKHG